MFKVKNFIQTFVHHFDKHICFTRTCALTFNSLLAIVPLFIILFEIVKRMPWFTQLYIKWQQDLLTHLSPNSASKVTDVLDQLIKQHQSLPIITIIFLLITTGLMVLSIEEALNDIFEVKRTKRRNMFLSLVIYISTIIITPCLFGILIYLDQNIQQIQLHVIRSLNLNLHMHLSSLFIKYPILQQALIIITEIILLFTFYTVLSFKKTPAKDKWIVSIIIIILIFLLKIMFGLYLQLVPTYKLIYGALAGIPIFFFWLYLCWLCFIIGAVLLETMDILRANNKHTKAKASSNK